MLVIDQNVWQIIWKRQGIATKFRQDCLVKSNQVSMTGMKTGEDEKMVFNGEINPNDYGIELGDIKKTNER